MPLPDDFHQRMRVAKPCGVGWERMTGDERVRFCRECRLHVYNISELTRAEAEALLARSEGRLCARIYRRADGTVMTRDCPVGVRRWHRRAARSAGAALTAMLSLFTVGFGQKRDKKDEAACRAPAVLKLKRTAAAEKEKSSLAGSVLDATGAAIPGARVSLTHGATGRRWEVVASEDGQFIFEGLTAGLYTLEISAEGFDTYRQSAVMLNAGEKAQADPVTLMTDIGLQTIGIVTVDIEKELPSSEIKTVFVERMIRSLPRPE